MTDIALGAPEAHLLVLNQRPHPAFRHHIPTRSPRDCHCSIPGIVPILLPRPESHSP
jgi:hypothetical protein